MIDLVFPVNGSPPPDHSYALFGALCRRQPAFHGHHPVGVFPISDHLRLRLPEDKLGQGMRLRNVELELDGTRIRLGEGQVEEVRAALPLICSWVTFNGASQRVPFLARLREVLEEGAPEVGERHFRTIKGLKVSGFAVTLRDMSPEQAQRLCEQGLGGRRHFGGGLFLPLGDPGPARAQVEGISLECRNASAEVYKSEIFGRGA